MKNHVSAPEEGSFFCKKETLHKDSSSSCLESDLKNKYLKYEKTNF